MEKEEFTKRCINYMAVLGIFIQEYEIGIITDEEFDRIEERVAKKCDIPALSVYRIKTNDLMKTNIIRKLD